LFASPGRFADEVKTKRMSADWKLPDDLLFNSPRCSSASKKTHRDTNTAEKKGGSRVTRKERNIIIRKKESKKEKRVSHIFMAPLFFTLSLLFFLFLLWLSLSSDSELAG
jgi:hypothetical protein